MGERSDEGAESTLGEGEKSQEGKKRTQRQVKDEDRSHEMAKCSPNWGLK